MKSNKLMIMSFLKIFKLLTVIAKYDIVIYNLVLLLYINEFRRINLDYILRKEVLGNENSRLYKTNG